MRTYIELKEIENNILNQKYKYNQELYNLVELTYNYIKEYPYISKIISKVIHNKNFNNINDRYIIIIDSIEQSNIDLTLKNDLLIKIKNISNDIFLKLQALEKYNNELNNVIYPEKEERKEYIKDKKNKFEELKSRNDMYTNMIKKCNDLLNEEDSPEELKNDIKQLIEKYIKIKEELKQDVKELITAEDRKTLREELDLISKEETNKENTINSEEKQESENLNDSAVVIKENLSMEVVNDYNNKINNEIKTGIKVPYEFSYDNLTEEELTEKLSPLIPENKKKVKEKHQANPTLIKNIAKFGLPSLGIISIISVITFLALNPQIILAFFGGSLVLDSAKEKVKK